MQEDGELVWTVTEASAAGETVIGVYTSLSQARDVVSRLGGEGRLEDYRIEGHALNHGKESDLPWQVSLDRAGRHVDTLPFTGCSCAASGRGIGAPAAGSSGVSSPYHRLRATAAASAATPTTPTMMSFFTVRDYPLRRAHRNMASTEPQPAAGYFRATLLTMGGSERT